MCRLFDRINREDRFQTELETGLRPRVQVLACLYDKQHTEAVSMDSLGVVLRLRVDGECVLADLARGRGRGRGRQHHLLQPLAS